MDLQDARLATAFGGRAPWRTGLAAAALFAGLLLPGESSAIPFTDCFTRSTVSAESERAHDATDGNYWGRRATFTLDSSLCSELETDEVEIGQISVIVKTPFQIDVSPTDVDDIDTVQDAIDLVTALSMLEIADGFDHWAVNAIGEPPPGDPLVGASGDFTSVEYCIDAGSVDGCEPSPDGFMVPVGEGLMIFTVVLSGEDRIQLSGENLTFSLTTLIHSNVFDAPPMGQQALAPELVIGYAIVPEPRVLALLLLPALGLLAFRRGRS